MLNILIILLNLFTVLPRETVIITHNPVTIEQPLKIPLLLSGNFGELRNNHFHSGLDFKTQGRTGLPVYCAEDGYVSRISVSPYGYGYALYVDHPSGITTVYGHLSRFAPFIAGIVERKQYEAESFTVNLYFKKDEIKVHRGQIIAYSGNTGSSGGPHLHFEMRETQSEFPINPALYFKDKLTDTRAPEVRLVSVFPVLGEGVVAGKGRRFDLKPVTQGGTSYTTSIEPSVWGNIYFGVKAYDRMNNTGNIYGIYSLRVWVDEKPVFSFFIDRFSFDVTRSVNSLIDYADWRKNRSFVMRCLVDPGNPLPIYSGVVNGGVVTIDEERDYHIRYQLSDIFGNTSNVSFTVKGRKQPIPSLIPKQDERLFRYDTEYFVKRDGLEWTLPKGTLFENFIFGYSCVNSPAYVSAIHNIGDEYIPLKGYTTLRIRVDKDTIADKRQYYMVRITGAGQETSCGGKYENGYLTVKVRDMGRYAIKIDNEAPVLLPLKEATWGKTGLIRIRIKEQGSGLSSFRGEIDGKFILFSMDGKTNIAECRLSTKYVVKGKMHKVIFFATDGCGNTRKYETKFYW